MQNTRRNQIKTWALVLFLLLVCVLVTLALKDNRMSDSRHSSEKSKIVAVLTGELSLPLAPENISSVPLFQIHTNLWGTLLSKEMGRGLSNIVNISENEKEITFRLKPDLKFSNGRELTADDVVFSLNRLMSRQASGHFNAKEVIESVRALGDHDVLVTLRFPSKALQYLLTVSEMGIVPRESVDADGNLKSLAITSGPYSVKGEPEKNRVVLEKNPFYLATNSEAPDEVEVLLKRGPEAMLESSLDEGIDFIEVYENAVLENLDSLKKNSDLRAVETRPSLSMMLVVDADRVPLAQRRALSRLLSKKFSYVPRVGIEKRSYEMLPPGTFGSLGLKAPLNEIGDDAYLKDLPQAVTIRVNGSMSDLAKSLLETLKEASIEVVLLRRGDEEIQDMILLGQGMNTQCPEIEFHLAMLSQWAYLKTSDDEKKLVEQALHTSDDKARSEIIQKIGRAVLEDGRVFPLVVSSYVHVYRTSRLVAPNRANYDGDVHFNEMRIRER